MTRAHLFLVGVAAILLPVAAPADAEDLTTPPIATAIAIPDGADAMLVAESGRRTCSTTAVPPNQFSPTDVTDIHGRIDVSCGEGDYSAIARVQLVFVGSSAGTGGTPVGVPGSAAGPVPLSASTSVSKKTHPSGWYKTTGWSEITYPFALNTRQHPGQGCGYVDGDTIRCEAASSPVHIGTLAWIHQFIGAE